MSYELSGQLIETLRGARHIAVLTGAGISAESGIPTFRQAQTGLWAQYDPQQLATPEAFRRDAGLVWRWYQWRREIVSGAQPNPGHVALVQLQSLAPKSTLITQNIDDLHRQAGSTGVLELHGNLLRNKCFENEHVVNAGDELPPLEPGRPPRCPRCHSLLRPDVVWFGEALPAGVLQAAVHAAETCDLFIVAGTSALVHPAATLPLIAMEHGAPLLELNPQRTPLSPYADYQLEGPSGEILPRLVEAAWPELAA